MFNEARQATLFYKVNKAYFGKFFEISAILNAQKLYSPSYHGGQNLNKLHKKIIQHAEVLSLSRRHHSLANKESQEEAKQEQGKYYLSE